MVYLDYSATTPVHPEVIDVYSRVCESFIGNPNSYHKLGVEAKKLIDASSEQIANLFKIKKEEIIYTSGASEANNLAIKGVCSYYENRGKHLLTTELEHSSVLEVFHYLEKKGYTVEYVSLLENGLVDLQDLENKIRDDTLLVSIASVNSEVGVSQDIGTISSVIKKKNPKTIFHSDVTQSIGKQNVDFSCLDMASLSCQKFYGMKGIGALYKRESLMIDPLIHGGRSTTPFRSGTPATPLIVSFARALRLAYEDLEEKIIRVHENREYLVEQLQKMGVRIHSNDFCLPHIVNISCYPIKPETMQHALEEKEIYVSTQTACSKGEKSLAVYAITKDMDAATHSIRISLSHLTTKEEMDTFLKTYQELLTHLNLRGQKE